MHVSARSPSCSRRIRPSVTRLATAGLWEHPANLRDRDLFYGPWGAGRAPDPAATYTFVRPKHGGVNPGVIVRDDRGRVWHVKQAPRQQPGRRGPGRSRALPRAVGRRLSPAAGLLPAVVHARRREGHARRTGRTLPARGAVDQGAGTWSWHQNPFVGTRPYEGLLVDPARLQQLGPEGLEQHDLRAAPRRPDRTLVRRSRSRRGARRTGRLAPKRNNIERFERQTFITGVTDGFVNFNYRGWQPGLVRHAITVDDVRWAAALLVGLSDRQWHDAFRAGGYPDDLSEALHPEDQGEHRPGAAIAGGVPRRAGGREAVNGAASDAGPRLPGHHRRAAPAGADDGRRCRRGPIR